MRAAVAKHLTPVELHRPSGEEATCIAALLPRLLLQRPRYLSEPQGLPAGFQYGQKKASSQMLPFSGTNNKKVVFCLSFQVSTFEGEKNLLFLFGSGVVAPKGWSQGTWNRNCGPWSWGGGTWLLP